MDNVRIIFVLSDECSKESDASEIMLHAFEECKQNVSNVMWAKNSELMNLSLNKTDFVVFEQFTGESYETLRQTKCARILGPWAIRICLMENKPIPNYPWPIYNVAMYKYVVTCSGLSKEHKKMITEKVELMGGRCDNSLIKDSTHLVIDKVLTDKYFAAGEAGVKLMKSAWIEEVWRASEAVNIDANDTKFDIHRCRSFEGLTISTTGMTAAERSKAEQLVKQNGGKFTGQLVIANTDILCCGAKATTTAKYKAARQANIICVNNTWLTDSVTKGYAQRPTKYTVQKCTSTPTKSDQMINPEYSVLSAIGQPDFSPRSFVEETFDGSRSRIGSTKRKATLKDEYGKMVDSLDIKKAKLAGQYLDGCSVYLTGFSADHVEKLNKILNFSGATRNDKFSDRITHVIVGDPSFHEVNIIRNKYSSCALVSVKWLLDSIEQERPVSEDNYLIRNTDFDKSCLGSPLSKKGLSLLRSNRTVTEKDIAEESMNVPDVPDKGDDIVRQYLKPNNPAEEDTIAKLLQNMQETDFSKSAARNLSKDFQPQSSSTQQSSISVTQDKSSEMSGIFEHLKFSIVADDDYEQIKVMIEKKNGQVVPKSFKGVPDYSVFPIFVDHNFSCSTAAESVNKLFIYDCCQQEELITNIVYYHRPFSIPTSKPLVNCVITISTYSGVERMFLNAVIEILGGVAQEQFARIKNVTKGFLVSTHLVSPEPKGKKYEGALKWGLPVVSGDWLMECLQTEKKVGEEKYLLGDSVAPKRIDEETISNNSTVKMVSKTSITPKRIDEELISNNSTVKMVSKTFTTSTSNPVVSKVETPVNKKYSADETSSKSQTSIDPKTPVYQRFFHNKNRPSFSPVTPVNKILRNFNENAENSSGQRDSKEYSLPKPWMNIKTPETPLGAFLTPNPSPNLRKQWEYWLQQFPDKSVSQSQASTPLSEIKERIWDNILRRDGISQPNFNDSANENDEQADMNPPSDNSNPKTPENQHLVNKLQQLEDMLTASGGAKRTSRNFQSTNPVPAGNREYQDSQPCTVGWDFRQGETPKQKLFSISGVDSEARNNMVSQIELLGGLVTELSSYDPSCTHLLCPKPVRNEKTLSCMAAGKLILHISYLEKSLEAGEFLDEEEYEFGNPKSVGKFPVGHDSETERRMNQMHRWRKEISRRGYGAFNDMRAIVMAQKMEPIARVIEAGGGVVIDVKPPFDDTVHATHCLLEQKNVIDFNDYVPLARQGIFVLGTVYISDYLHDPTKDIRDCILPYFTKYYSRF